MFGLSSAEKAPLRNYPTDRNSPHHAARPATGLWHRARSLSTPRLHLASVDTAGCPMLSSRSMRKTAPKPRPKSPQIHLRLPETVEAPLREEWEAVRLRRPRTSFQDYMIEILVAHLAQSPQEE